MAILPPGATADAAVLLTTRGVRAFADGLVSVILPGYLLAVGLDGLHVGAVVAATLVGSALLTLVVGLKGHQLRRLRVLQAAAALMAATGLGFAAVVGFPALLLVGFVGTLNPSGGDVSVFLPTEQALLPATAPDRERTALFGRYSLIGSTVAAFGALAAGVPSWLADRFGASEVAAQRLTFLVYAFLGVVVGVLYRQLSSDIEPEITVGRPPLGASKRIVYGLAALFSLDSFGGGFVVQSLLALWLFRRFDLSIATAGAIFFWSGLLSGVSALLAVRIARRIGLIRTMVFTHLPANALLMLTPLMPGVVPAVACLLARSFLSQMDVPVRTSYVMAVVSPEERPAAASVTNVPRSLAAAAAPLGAGWMLDHSTFGWPLLVGGALKAIYDVLLLLAFRHVRPPEER